MNKTQQNQITELQVQYALVDSSQSRINEIDAAIKSNQAIIDALELVDTASDLVQERQMALVDEALGLDRKTELTRLEVAIVKAQKSDALANQITKDSTARARETIAGLEALKAAEEEKLKSLQTVGKEMRVAYVRQLAHDAGERYAMAAKQAVDALVDVMAADVAFNSETGSNSTWATRTILGDFYLSLPALIGGEVNRPLNSGNPQMHVECDRNRIYACPERAVRTSAIIATLNGDN